jgi:hypothetical protein
LLHCIVQLRVGIQNRGLSNLNTQSPDGFHEHPRYQLICLQNFLPASFYGIVIVESDGVANAECSRGQVDRLTQPVQDELVAKVYEHDAYLTVALRESLRLRRGWLDRVS